MAEVWYIRNVYMEGPQGSVIGPLIWILIYEGLLKIPVQVGCKLNRFANDVGMMVTATALEQLRISVIEAMNCISQWLTDHGLELALNKTEYASLNGKRMPPPFTFSVCNLSLKPAKAVKYLGLLIDTRRNFRQHIATTTEKAIKTAGSLSRNLVNLKGTKIFVRRAYYAALESIVLYAAPVWADINTLEHISRCVAFEALQTLLATPYAAIPHQRSGSSYEPDSVLFVCPQTAQVINEERYSPLQRYS